MRTMVALSRAELLRWRATPTTLGLLGLGVLVVLGVDVLTILAADRADLATAAQVQSLLLVGGSTAYPLAFVLGALGMAGEFHHRTIGVTALAAPRRPAIVAAKVVVYALLGALAGVVAYLVGVAVTLPLLASRGVDLGLEATLTAPYLPGAALAPALFGAIGVGLGALLRSQPLVVGLGLAWIFVVDFTTLFVLGDAARYLPGGAALTVLAGGSDALSTGQATLVLLAYVAVFAGAGTVLLRRSRLR